MSLLTPERVPVKVYRWDDAGAPALNKTAGCVMRIFKACLDTGYGSKAGAGWSTAFDGVGTTVLRPEVGMHTDFYLRLSADTGKEIAAQVYLNMTDASTGDLKLQCATAFKYAKGNSSGKWLIVASTRGVWFFSEQRLDSVTETDKKGAFFICGDIAMGIDQATRPVFLQHSGGTQDVAYYSSILGTTLDGQSNKTNSAYLIGKILIDGISNDAEILSAINGHNQYTSYDFANPACFFAKKNLCVVPGAYIPTSGAAHRNFDKIQLATDIDSLNAIAFGSSAWGDTNIYISTDYWVY